MEQVNRKIIISEEITEQTAERVISHISAINEYDAFMEESIQSVKGKYTPQPIELIISSGGGSAHAGFAIIGAMEMSATEIITYGLGLVGSMALGIYVSGDVRVAHNLTRFMYHSVAYGEMGKLQDHREALTEVEILQETYDLLFTRATNITKERMEEIQSNRNDFHFSAEESVTLGVSDSIYGRFEVECDPENNPCEDCDCGLAKKDSHEDNQSVDDLVNDIVSSTNNSSKEAEDSLKGLYKEEADVVLNIDIAEDKEVAKEIYLEILNSFSEDDLESWKQDTIKNGIDGLEEYERDIEEEDTDKKLEYKVNEKLGEEKESQDTFINRVVNKLKRNK